MYNKIFLLEGKSKSKNQKYQINNKTSNKKEENKLLENINKDNKKK